MTNGTRLEGICEVFNLHDRTTFTDADNIPTAVGTRPTLRTFDPYTQAGPPLRIQRAAKLPF